MLKTTHKDTKIVPRVSNLINTYLIEGDFDSMVDESIGTLQLAGKNGELFFEQEFNTFIDKIIDDIKNENYRSNSEHILNLYKEIAKINYNDIKLLHYDNPLKWLRAFDVLVVNDNSNTCHGESYTDMSLCNYDLDSKVINHAFILLVNPTIMYSIHGALTHELNHYYSSLNHRCLISEERLGNIDITLVSRIINYVPTEITTNRKETLNNDDDKIENLERKLDILNVSFLKNFYNTGFSEPDFLNTLKQQIKNPKYIASCIMFMMYSMSRAERSANQESIFSEIRQYYEEHTPNSTEINTLTDLYREMFNTTPHGREYYHIIKGSEYIINNLPSTTEDYLKTIGCVDILCDLYYFRKTTKRGRNLKAVLKKLNSRAVKYINNQKRMINYLRKVYAV